MNYEDGTDVGMSVPTLHLDPGVQELPAGHVAAKCDYQPDQEEGTLELEVSGTPAREWLRRNGSVVVVPVARMEIPVERAS